MTRLQIIQTALKFCSKKMPNFYKRRFRYFVGGFLHKRINIGAFSAVIGPKCGVELVRAIVLLYYLESITNACTVFFV